MARKKPSTSKRTTSRRPVPPPSSGGAAQPSPASPSDQRATLAEEYAYVLTDLRRIGVLAAALIVALVILRFFI